MHEEDINEECGWRRRNYSSAELWMAGGEGGKRMEEHTRMEEEGKDEGLELGFHSVVGNGDLLGVDGTRYTFALRGPRWSVFCVVASSSILCSALPLLLLILLQSFI